MKQYGVKVPVNGYTTIWVEAESEEEAVQKAIDGEGLNEAKDDLDWSYDSEEEIERFWNSSKASEHIK